MTLYEFLWVVLHCWVVSLLLFKALGEDSGFSVNFLEAPKLNSNLNSATFSFNVSVDGQKVSVGENGPPCTGSNITCPCSGSSNITCQLDNGITTDCGGKEVSYSGLQDGNHKFEVCSVASPAVLCSTYSWSVDTVPPTAYITGPSPPSNATNVAVNISFTERCTGEDGKDGFKCSSRNACNLLVHGDGQVIPSSLVTLVPARKYTLLVGLSSWVERGNVTLEMDNISCFDTAGNKFMKAANSTFNISFDRRSVLVELISVVPEKILPRESGNVSLLATNNKENLKLYLNFSEPLRNKSIEVLNSLKMSQGKLDPITGENLGDRTYGFKILDVPSFAMINISLDSESIITERGKPVSKIEPVTFLYDSRRPQVRLSTISRTTRQNAIPVNIDFSKPVLSFNISNISISGGKLLRSGDIIKNRMYFIDIQAEDEVVYVNVSENIAEDVFGNKNKAAAVRLEVAQYSDPPLSRVTGILVTSTFGITCLAHGILAVSSATLVSTGAISGASSTLMSDPAANLFLSLSHIQLIALSRWLPVNLPVEYYAYAKALQWSIPYLNLPWEKEHVPTVHVKVKADSGKFNQSDFELCIREKQEEKNHKEEISDKTSLIPLKPGLHRRPSLEECQSTFGTEGSEITRSLYFECLEVKAWQDFWKCIFWLAVFGGSAILLHALLIIIVRIRWPQIQRDLGDPQIQREPQIQRDMESQTQRETQIQRDLTEPQTQRDLREPQTQRDYGVLTFPRFEIFCIIVALPCICKASAGLIKVGMESDDKPAVAVGIVLLGVVGLILVSFFIFLLVGITLGMLFLYDEDYWEQEAQKQKLLRRIGRVTLGPVLKGEWTWKNESKKVYLRIFGPLFEDLRGLRYEMLPKGNPHNGVEEAQDAGATGVNRSDHGDHSNNENEIEDVEALQVNPQKNGDEIISYDDKTEDARGTGANRHKNGDEIVPSDHDKTVATGPGVDPHIKLGDSIVALGDKREDPSLMRKLLDILGLGFIQMLFGAIGTTFMQKLLGILATSFMRKLFGILRTYYVLLESVRQVILGIMAGAFMGEEVKDISTKLLAATILLSISYFLLFFLFLLRPFVSKRGLLVEIISIACEVGVFTLITVGLCSDEDESKFKVWTVLLPFIGYLATMINQGYAMYIQIKNLDQDDNKSFLRGLKRAFSGLAIFFTLKVMEKLENYPPTEPRKQGTGDTGGSSSKLDESGKKQPSEPTKYLSSISKRGSGGPNDPSSTSGNLSIPSPSTFGR